MSEFRCDYCEDCRTVDKDGNPGGAFSCPECGNTDPSSDPRETVWEWDGLLRSGEKHGPIVSVIERARRAQQEHKQLHPVQLEIKIESKGKLK